MRKTIIGFSIICLVCLGVAMANPSGSTAPSADDANKFATAFLRELEKDRKSEDGQRDRVKVETAVQLIQTDILRTDSLIHPVVVKVVLREDHSLSSQGMLDFKVITYDARFARSDGKWVPVSLRETVGKHTRLIPGETDNQGSTVGSFSDWSLQAIGKVMPKP